jgi:hypothetical protein
MKKAGLAFILLGAALELAGCAAGPCAGFGCPAFAPGGAQSSQPALKSAAKMSDQTTHAKNQSAIAPEAKPGQ